MAEVDVKSCFECGASIYPEHIASKKAGMWGGQLLCVHCFASHQKQQVTLDPGEFGSMTSAAPQRQASKGKSGGGQQPFDDEEQDVEDVKPRQPEESKGADEESISLDSLLTNTASSQALQSQFASGDEESRKYRRHLQHHGKGALRCRIFHAKLNIAALKFMEDQINEWVDEHPEIEIKHASTQVGVFEGKSVEPHLIITIFY